MLSSSTPKPPNVTHRFEVTRDNKTRNATFNLHITMTIAGQTLEGCVLQDTRAEKSWPLTKWYYHAYPVLSHDESRLFVLVEYLEAEETLNHVGKIPYLHKTTLYYDLICYDIKNKKMERFHINKVEFPQAKSSFALDDFMNKREPFLDGICFNNERGFKTTLHVFKHLPDKILISLYNETRLMDVDSFDYYSTKNIFDLPQVLLSPCKQYFIGHFDRKGVIIFENNPRMKFVKMLETRTFSLWNRTAIALSPDNEIYVVTQEGKIQRWNYLNSKEAEITEEKSDGPDFKFQHCEFNEEGELVVSSAEKVVSYRFANLTTVLDDATDRKIPLQLHSIIAGYTGMLFSKRVNGLTVVQEDLPRTSSRPCTL